jgi:hypothetical protein
MVTRHRKWSHVWKRDVTEQLCAQQLDPMLCITFYLLKLYFEVREDLVR